MISLQKVTKANAAKIENMFENLIDFVLDEDGRVVEVLFFKKDLDVCLNVRSEGFGLSVSVTDHSLQSGEDDSYTADKKEMTNLFVRVLNIVQPHFSDVTFVDDFVYRYNVKNNTDAEILKKYSDFHHSFVAELQ